MAAALSNAILLVDGYNIIGAWRRLKSLKSQKGLDSARAALVEELANYSAVQQFETWAVFDAYTQRTPASQEVITDYLSVHYTAYGQTADSYIERACSKFREDARKFTQRLIVATSDNVHRQTAVGYGAEGMTALRLEAEVRSAQRQVKHRTQKRRRKGGNGPSRRMASGLTPDVQAKLDQLRRGL